MWEQAEDTARQLEREDVRAEVLRLALPLGLLMLAELEAMAERPVLLVLLQAFEQFVAEPSVFAKDVIWTRPMQRRNMDLERRREGRGDTDDIVGGVTTDAT